jgi:threonine synthase
VVSVTDEEIFAAKKVIDECGVGCEPASAASVAGVRALVASGLIGRDERVVAVLTGHLLKDPGVDASAVTSSEALTPADALALLERVVAS